MSENFIDYLLRNYLSLTFKCINWKSWKSGSNAQMMARSTNETTWVRTREYIIIQWFVPFQATDTLTRIPLLSSHPCYLWKEHHYHHQQHQQNTCPTIRKPAYWGNSGPFHCWPYLFKWMCVFSQACIPKYGTLSEVEIYAVPPLLSPTCTEQTE